MDVRERLIELLTGAGNEVVEKAIENHSTFLKLISGTMPCITISQAIKMVEDC